LRSNHRYRPRLPPPGPRSPHAGAAGGHLRRRALPVQRQAHLQAAGCQGLWTAPGLYRLEEFPSLLCDRADCHRPGRGRERGHRGISRLPSPGLLVAGGRHVSRVALGDGGRIGRCAAGLVARRDRNFWSVHPASLGAQSIYPLAPAALSQLQRPRRRRAAARRALSRVSRVAEAAVRRVRKAQRLFQVALPPARLTASEPMSVSAAPAVSVTRPSEGLLYYGWVNVFLAALAMLATMPGRTHGLGL